MEFAANADAVVCGTNDGVSRARCLVRGTKAGNPLGIMRP
jgi:hypothetical protein